MAPASASRIWLRPTPARSIEIAPASLKIRRSPLFPQSRKDQIAPGLEVERRDNQFAETRLAEVLEQQLGISPAQLGRRGLFRRCRPPEDMPQRRTKMPKAPLGAPGCSNQSCPPSCPDLRWPGSLGLDGGDPQRRHGQHTKRHRETQRDQPGYHRGQGARRERSSAPDLLYADHQAISSVDVNHLHQKAQGIRHQAGRKHEKRNGKDRNRQQARTSPPTAAPDATHTCGSAGAGARRRPPPRFSARHRLRQTARRPHRCRGRSSRRSSRRLRAARAAHRRDRPRRSHCR